MPDHADIACRLLRFEQQLKAYEKLHADELAELWRTLNECKQLVAALSQAAESGHSPTPTLTQADGDSTAPTEVGPDGRLAPSVPLQGRRAPSSA